MTTINGGTGVNIEPAATGNSFTISNTGVLSVAAGAGIGIDASTGDVSVSNTSPGFVGAPIIGYLASSQTMSEADTIYEFMTLPVTPGQRYLFLCQFLFYNPTNTDANVDVWLSDDSSPNTDSATVVPLQAGGGWGGCHLHIVAAPTTQTFWSHCVATSAGIAMAAASATGIPNSCLMTALPF